MPCERCTKINPIPACLDRSEYGDDSAYLITEITFPGIADSVLQGRLKNISTGRLDYFYTEITDGIPDEIDLTDFTDFPDDVFELSFWNAAGVQVEFTITNPDDTEVVACCAEFSVLRGLSHQGELAVSTTECEV